MAANTDLTNETICDLKGQPLDRRAAALLKAVDKLLTVGAYYSTDHDQYRVVSEKTCAQVVEAIKPDPTMAIEITASGMMIQSQLVDPHHRNVRLLHDLLVPLNIARLEISADLTPADLRLAISALQLHKQNLGNTEGFQEIRIDNLPPTVSTASRSVVSDEGQEEDQKGFLDGLLGSDSPSEGSIQELEFLSDSEKLAREFMEVVNRILENLEQVEDTVGVDGSTPHPDSNPGNIRALREALMRLVEVNPDPADLARLIEHAKRALDLSRDPSSVDLVFSLLKKEIDSGGDWKYKARKKNRNQSHCEFKLTLDELRQSVADLDSEGSPPADPRASSLGNYLGICFHLLAADPSEPLEMTLTANLEQIIAGRDLTREDLNLCSAAVATSALKANQVVLDRVLFAFCGPLRFHRPDYLVKFWTRLWETLDPGRRALVWPHLVSDLLLGMDSSSPERIERLWLAAGELDSKAAAAQVSRLECTPALRTKNICPALMSLPLTPMYSVHLALMKSSQALIHGPRLHDHLLRHPPNGLTEILMLALGNYDADKDSFYLSLIKQSGGESITPDLRRMAARLIGEALTKLPRERRGEEWVVRSINWLGKLDPVFSRPTLARICDERKFIFFKAWPAECRDMAGSILEATPPEPDVIEEV
jgi:hypothetical protein